MPHNITTAAGKQGKSLVTHTKLLTECRRVLDKLTVAYSCFESEESPCLLWNTNVNSGGGGKKNYM
jgi:hypothetical protein